MGAESLARPRVVGEGRQAAKNIFLSSLQKGTYYILAPSSETVPNYTDIICTQTLHSDHFLSLHPHRRDTQNKHTWKCTKKPSDNTYTQIDLDFPSTCRGRQALGTGKAQCTHRLPI